MTLAGFGIIICTPCGKSAFNDDVDLRLKAGQNVVFEHGFLWERLADKMFVHL